MTEPHSPREKLIDWGLKQGVSTVLLLGLACWMIYKEQWLEPTHNKEMHEHCERVHKVYAESISAGIVSNAAAIERLASELKNISLVNDQASHRDFEVIRELLKTLGINVDAPRKVTP